MRGPHLHLRGPHGRGLLQASVLVFQRGHKVDDEIYTYISVVLMAVDSFKHLCLYSSVDMEWTTRPTPTSPWSSWPWTPSSTCACIPEWTWSGRRDLHLHLRGP